MVNLYNHCPLRSDPTRYHRLTPKETAGTVAFIGFSFVRLENRRYLSNRLVSRDFNDTSVFVTLKGVRSRNFSRISAATCPHTPPEVPRMRFTRHHIRRTFAVAGHCPSAAGKPPPHRRRVSAATGDFLVRHHSRWPLPATGLRRLAGRLAGNSVTRLSRLSESSR